MKNLRIFGIYWIGMLLLGGCGPVKEQHIENRYGPVTWSSDGNQVAYFKTYIEYQTIQPRFSLFVGEDSKQQVIEKIQLFVCVNNSEGSAELCVGEITLPEAYPLANAIGKIEWSGDYIRYGAIIPDQFSTDLYQIAPDGSDKQILSSSDNSLTDLEPTLLNANNQELYSGYGNYGFLGHQTIYLFDHQQRQVQIYLHDPLSLERPFLPAYSITER